METVEALKRIALLQEREGEATNRVSAFRRAAETVQQTPADDLARRARDGTLEALSGVGKVTALVIQEALNGEIPVYLRRLEASEGQPLDEATEALCAALRGDLHTHSDWSDGGSPIEEMAATAIGLGHDYIALTDHTPQQKNANGLTAERLRAQLELVAGFNEALAPFRILTGIEGDILEDGSLDQDPELLDALDVVVASVHSKLRMPAADMTRRMLRAVENPRVNVLGHCTGRVVKAGGRRGGTRPESESIENRQPASSARRS